MQDNALVDTCILVYLVDKTETQKHEKAKAWLKSIAEKKEVFFVSVQNLREFSSIALRKTSLPAGEINPFLEVFAGTFTLIFDNFSDITRANVFSEKNRKVFWDALLAATAQRHGIKTILTENTKDFSQFQEIKTKNPLD